MSEKISIETSKLITPENLRLTYGNVVGNEICFILPMIASTDRAVTRLLNVLLELSTEAQQLEFLHTVRSEYYKREANSLLKDFN